MNEAPKARKFGRVILVILLWLIVFVLGLNDIYAINELFMLLMVALGSTPKEAMNSALAVMYVLALIYLVFLIASTEYHYKHFNTLKSWRLFGWTLGVEVIIYIVYLIF